MLAANAEAPVVTETTVSADLLEALEIVTELGVDTVGEDLRVLAVDNVALSVEEPGGDLVLGGVLDDGDDTLKLFRGELTSTVIDMSVSLGFSLILCPVPGLWGHRARVCSARPRMENRDKAYRLFRSTSAFLQTRLE